MAAEMSCLTGVDEDDKDAEPEINAFTLLQEPVRMAQEDASCNNTFSKSPSEQNSVLDVLSNSDMLSSVGLGNGPSSHQATQAHELNSFSSEREETKSITPLKTVQEIDTAGIWGFDEDSPENSMDNFSGASDLHWNPHKDIMQFLWDSHGDSPGEESKEEVSSANNRRRRKRKMDMVVMVDPSEDLYPELSPKSSEELSDSESQEDTSPVSKVQKPRMSTKSQLTTTAKVSKYPNGTVKTIKDRLYNGPTRNSHENSLSHEISPLKKSLTVNSRSEEKPTCYPCSKCKLIFKKDHHLQRHMKSHVRVDPPDLSSKPFICRECGQSFRQSGSLIEHMSVHQEKRERLTEEIKSINNKRKEERKKLFCPQCTFVTQCPNTFVQHAKTHEKDKRKFRCEKCSFRFLSENELRRHNILQHTLITGKKQIEKDVSRMFSCNTCSYKATSKTVFKNHLLLRHEQTFEDYEAELQSEKKEPPLKKQLVPTDKSPVEDAEITSKILIKDQIAPNGASSPSESSDISDLFKNNKIKTGPKSNLTESKLDKSINVLLSRQRHGKKTTEQKTESNNSSVQDSKSDKESSDHLPGICEEVEESDIIQTCNKEPSSPTKNDLNCRNVPNLANEHSPVKKSPSKRKMSTPYRNTSDQDSCFILPKPSPKKINQEEEDEEEEEDGSDLEDREVFKYKDTDVIPNRFEKDIKKEKHIIYTYSRRMSMRGALQASKKLFEKIKTEEQEPGPDVTEIKEESIETDIIQENFEPHQIPLDESFSEDVLDLDIEMKSCPYCPAVFESGVGLSNHIRGHLHRAGVSYNERHAVPPEEVASHDKKPRIRRKMSALRRLKKALQNDSESDTVQSVHSCPLCGDSFDNRTGQSNHIRGHLKKLGKNFSKKSRSPLFVLRELMRDKKEYQRAIQILGRRRNHFQYGASKLSGYGFYRPMGFPRKNSIHSVNTEVEQRTHTFSLADMESDKRQPETKLDDKNSLSGTNALIGLLKKRKCQEEARLKGSSQMSKGTCAFSSSGEHCPGQRAASSLPKSSCEKGESNKVCVHCNATFHSGVSLSNHLRAYAKRKKNGIVDGTATECKIRRQRSRPGPKKKTQPLPQTPEEMYRLTCRFCDLVFQGPLSVQEDWVKHLQRHIMNTSVPHTGLGMVEVTSPPKTLRTDKDSSLMATNAAS